MKYTIQKDSIIFDKPIKKGKGNIKIYLTRMLDEREATDLPVATTDGNGTKKYSIKSLMPMMINAVHIRQDRLWGLLKGKWQIIEEHK